VQKWKGHCKTSGDSDDVKGKINVDDAKSKIEEKKIIKVQKEDFCVFQALDMDSFVVNNSRKRLLNKLSHLNDSQEFSQAIPNFAQEIYVSTRVPILPPHLCHFTLNKKAPCEFYKETFPELLPKPCHKWINHLYAMSMENGMMTLSSTQRYREKYVTTILYRPIEI